MKRISIFFLLIVFLSGCTTPAWGQATATSASTLTVAFPTATVPIAPAPETIVAPTLVPNPTATVDTRLPPEQWQKWPVVPAVTAHAIQIYQNGRTMGLDSHAFSKVGDCQSIKESFMGYFDIPERYSLGSDYAYLQQTINNFAGHFNTNGQAVRGGLMLQQYFPRSGPIRKPAWPEKTLSIVSCA